MFQNKLKMSLTLEIKKKKKWKYYSSDSEHQIFVQNFYLQSADLSDQIFCLLIDHPETKLLLHSVEGTFHFHNFIGKYPRFN